MKRALISVAVAAASSAGLSTSAIANAAIAYLSEQPVSMLTFGVQQLDEYIRDNRHDFHPDWTADDRVYASAHFNPSTGKIVININLGEELADNDQFERDCRIVLDQLRTKGGYNVTDGELYAHFDHSFYGRFFQQASQHDKMVSVLDEAIVVRFTANLAGLGHGICSGPLLSQTYTISGL